MSTIAKTNLTVCGQPLCHCSEHGMFTGSGCPLCLKENPMPYTPGDDPNKTFKAWGQEIRHCPQHGDYVGCVCPGCYPIGDVEEEPVMTAAEIAAKYRVQAEKLRGCECEEEPDLELVLVEWIDSAYQEAQIPVDKVCEGGYGIVLLSAGFLFDEDDGGIILVRDLCPTEEDVRHVMRIPRGCIKRVVKFPHNLPEE